MVKTTEDKGQKPAAADGGAQKKGPKVEEPPELSPEDQALKDNIELMVERMNDADMGALLLCSIMIHAGPETFGKAPGLDQLLVPWSVSCLSMCV